LVQVRDALIYLQEQQIRYYRLPADLGSQLAAEGGRVCERLIASVTALAREAGMRLSIHPKLHVALGSANADVADHALAEVIAHARVLDALECGSEAVIVLHIGGAVGGVQAVLERFAAALARLPTAILARVAVEQDEQNVSLVDLLWLYECVGTPLVFDALHFQLHNPERLALAEALGLALATWPQHVRAEVHFSTQRTEAHLAPAQRGSAARVIPPRHGQHADYINPFEFASLLRSARGLPLFDVMLEAKAGDLALLRLREDVRRYAPELAERVC
jgi:UV DNA damage endonuclease